MAELLPLTFVFVLALMVYVAALASAGKPVPVLTPRDRARQRTVWLRARLEQAREDNRSPDFIAQLEAELAAVSRRRLG